MSKQNKMRRKAKQKKMHSARRVAARLAEKEEKGGKDN